MANAPASALVWVGGGVEYFTSGIYLDYYNGSENTTSEVSQETGFRPFVEAHADFPVTERTRLALAGRAYGGNVDVRNNDTVALGGTPAFNATVDYKGVRGEAGVIFTPLSDADHRQLGFVAMAGVESFTRELKDDVYISKSEWTLPFIRLGAQYEAPETGGWSARGGLIVPFSTKIYWDSSDYTSHPEEVPSFYIGFGRRFARFFEAGFNYEGLRFDEVDPESAVATPRVETDTYQFYLKMGF